ncbi:unnamed protein product, partial [Mesorhabditis belari]|uniref:Thioesterase domain-containing protein n=1 Tax=Mesorhabditis belari TaxID=2138241 RepID=A0AAF3JA57_9BILA
MSTNAIFAKRLQFLFNGFQKMNSFMRGGTEGMRIVHADESKYRAEFEVNKEMVNPLDVMHGGCSATLLDVGCVATAFIRGQAVLSVNQELTCVGPGRLGETLVMEVELLRLGKTQCYTRGELRKKVDDSLVAFGTCTYVVSPSKYHPEKFAQFLASVVAIK